MKEESKVNWDCKGTRKMRQIVEKKEEKKKTFIGDDKKRNGERMKRKDNVKSFNKNQNGI